MKNLTLDIPIKPAPYLVVDSVTTTPEKLMPGNKAEFRLNVANNGTEKAESVSLRVFKDASQPFEFDEKSDFVGKLEPGENGDAVLKVTVDTNAVAKKYLLDVELRGIDDKNNVVIFRRTVPITVYPGTSSTSPLAAMGIFVVVGAVVAGYYWKKKK
jgi:hypothetical protein